MLVAEGEKGLILRHKGTWHFVFIERTCLLCPVWHLSLHKSAISRT